MRKDNSCSDTLVSRAHPCQINIWYQWRKSMGRNFRYFLSFHTFLGDFIKSKESESWDGSWHSDSSGRHSAQVHFTKARQLLGFMSLPLCKTRPTTGDRTDVCWSPHSGWGQGGFSPSSLGSEENIIQTLCQSRCSQHKPELTMCNFTPWAHPSF